MRICKRCKTIIEDNNAPVCPTCGKRMATAATYSNKSRQAKAAVIFGGLSLILFPPLGLIAILFALSSREETGWVMCPNAKAALVMGIIGCLLTIPLLLWLVSLR